jgi:hypothetical protein
MVGDNDLGNVAQHQPSVERVSTGDGRPRSRSFGIDPERAQVGPFECVRAWREYCATLARR